jgi:hypothetical protein
MKETNLFKEYIDEMESLIKEVSNHFPIPNSVPHYENLNYKGFRYRHDISQKTEELAVFLKLVRIISLLNTCLTLITEGYCNGVVALCRSIDEENQDIHFMFLTKEDPENISSKLKKSLLNSFYNEEENKNYARRQDILDAINKLEQKLLPLESSNSSEILYGVFSGFVHSKYHAIMELYSGVENLYNMKGKNLLIKSTVDNFYNYIYRSLNSIQLCSKLLQKHDVEQKAALLAIDFAKKADGKVLSPQELAETLKCYNDRFDA